MEEVVAGVAPAVATRAIVWSNGILVSPVTSAYIECICAH